MVLVGTSSIGSTMIGGGSFTGAEDEPPPPQAVKDVANAVISTMKLMRH